MAKRKVAEIAWSAMRKSRKFDHPAIKQAKEWLKKADTPEKTKWAQQNYYRMLHRYDRTLWQETMRNNPKSKFYSKTGGKRKGSLDRRDYDRKNTGRRGEDKGWK